MKLIDINQNIFIIWDGNDNNETWKVYYYVDKPPEFECGVFISSKVCFCFYVLTLHTYHKTLINVNF